MNEPIRKSSESRTHGFSLVELSLVIVVLGLLVGAIISGKALLQGAGIRSMISSAQSFKTSIAAFQDKYNGLPGDLTNASSYWGLAGGTTAGLDATCYNAQTISSIATCNGNGDGQLAWNYSTFNEGTMAFKHMVNAGYMNGRFSGGSHGSPQVITANEGPKSQHNPKMIWTFADYTALDSPNFSDWDFGPPVTGIALYLVPSGSGYKTPALTLSSYDAYTIDKKVDDSKPGVGKFFMWRNLPSCVDNEGSWAGNATPVADSLVNYTLTETPNTCPFQFIIHQG